LFVSAKYLWYGYRLTAVSSGIKASKITIENTGNFGLLNQKILPVIPLLGAKLMLWL